MPRDTWRNSHKPKVPESGVPPQDFELDSERLAYFLKNASKLRQEEKDYKERIRAERAMEKAAKERKRLKMKEKQKKSMEQKRLIKLGLLPDKKKEWQKKQQKRKKIK